MIAALVLLLLAGEMDGAAACVERRASPDTPVDPVLVSPCTEAELELQRLVADQYAAGVRAEGRILDLEDRLQKAERKLSVRQAGELVTRTSSLAACPEASIAPGLYLASAAIAAGAALRGEGGPWGAIAAGGVSLVLAVLGVLW